MQFRPLGRSGLQVSPLCFGGNVFGWTVDDATSFSLLDAWVDAGFNFIDTADVYSRWVPGHQGGESEATIGRWLKRSPSRRDQVVLATKVGSDMGQGITLAPGYIRASVEGSLKRLNTDRIDLYQSHRDDPATPMADVLGAYGELIARGTVKAIGASNFTATRLAEALATSKQHKLPRYECLQPLYNLVDRAEFETDLQPLCMKEEVGVINFYALAAGFLTGKYRKPEDAAQSARGKNTVAKYLNERGLRILKALDEAAQRTNSTPARVAVAWVMHRPGITSPIASATSLAQLSELVAAAELKLDAQALALLEQASAT